MDKLINKIKGVMPTKRRLVQLYSALLYNAYVRGFIKGEIYTGKAKVMCVPGLNCYSCPAAVGACPLGALQNAVASSGSRAPYYVLGILLLFGLTLGRTICGWLCPVGLVQELLHKLPTPKIGKNRVTRVLSLLKYAILAVFVIAVPLWYSLQNIPVPAFCKYICPAGTLEGAVGLLAHPANADIFAMLGILFTWKFVVLAIIAAACVFVYRAFCRFICPLGAIYGLFARVAIIGVKVEKTACTDCGRCVGCCPMDIKRVGDRECIGCMKCIDKCPENAISFRAGRVTLKNRGKAKKANRYAWAAAFVVLAAVLVFFNLPEENTATPAVTTVESELPVGGDAGMYAPDFTVPLYGENGGEFTLSEYRGKTVVVNFWATWCGPCCEELPYFDELYKNYDDDIAVIAVHSDLVTDDVEGYLALYDYEMPFALDTDGSVIAAFGGSTMLPQTVIIDENGMVTYNAVGSLNYEKLESLIKETDK